MSDAPPDMNDWNAKIIEEFRANEGKVASFGDSDMVILHTTGAKSGKPRENPLVALVEGDDMYLVASKGGAPSHPDWYYNLKATPKGELEYGTERLPHRGHRGHRRPSATRSTPVRSPSGPASPTTRRPPPA